jgi:hypothetical protein
MKACSSRATDLTHVRTRVTNDTEQGREASNDPRRSPEAATVTFDPARVRSHQVVLAHCEEQNDRSSRNREHQIAQRDLEVLERHRLVGRRPSLCHRGYVCRFDAQPLAQLRRMQWHIVVRRLPDQR